MCAANEKPSHSNVRLVVCDLVIGRAQAAIASLDRPPQIVEVPSGKLHLKAFLWKPADPGPFPAVLFNHGSGVTADQTAGLPIADAAREIAPLFVAHGYAFLYLFRRSQGLSASQAPFIQEVLQREETAHGKGRGSICNSFC